MEPRAMFDSRAFAWDQSLTQFASLVGVPSILFQCYGPQIQEFLGNYPEFMALLAGGVGIASLHHIATQHLPPWLPTANLNSNDPLYKSLCRLIERSEILRKLEMSAESTELRRARGSISWADQREDTKDVSYMKSGTRLFFHDSTLFILQVEPRESDSQGRPTAQGATLRALAFQYAPIKALLQQAWELERQESKGKKMEVRLIGKEIWGENKWTRKLKLIRPLDTIDIDEQSKFNLIADIANYLDEDTRTWYTKRGIPYRRGYMFFGPPGTGKSSLCMAIAGRFDLPLYQISLTGPGMNDFLLVEMLDLLPDQCVLLLEDIDSAGLTREVATTSESEEKTSAPDSDDKPGRNGRKSQGVTLSGLLNALDGASAPEGHILIMSTNALDALDPALVRAGRIDYTVEFQNATKPMAENIFKRLMAGSGVEDTELCIKAAMFAGQIPEHVFAPAAVQGYLLDYKGNPDAAVSGVGKWVADFLERKKAKSLKSEAVVNTPAVNAKSSRKRKASTVQSNGRVLRPRKR